MKRTTTTKITYMGLLFSMILSCKKFVEVEPPPTQLVRESVFSSNTTATAAVLGIYTTMVNTTSFANGGASSISVLSGLSADELVSYSGSTNANYQFYQNALLPDNSALNTAIWANAYKYIFAANQVIKGLEGANVTPAIKSQLTGEALFIRAFCHFYLVNLFGDIPLAITTDYETNTAAGRTPKAEVFKQIIEDLKNAQGLLMEAYIKPDGTIYPIASAQRVRPNKYAATALLSRVYLYNEEWSNAEQQASTVIGKSDYYSIMDNLNGVFLPTSTEAIWQFNNTNAAAEATYFTFSGAPTRLTLSDQLMNAFEANDKRKTNWTKMITSGTKTYYQAFKYKVASGTPATEFSTILRLSEQYLIRAEARAKLDKLDIAKEDLNKVRLRAGLIATTANDKASILTAILHERQTELFTEWGHRWLDLKRTGTEDAVMGAVTPLKGGTWNTNWMLYPIPTNQIVSDPNSSQNLGY